METTKEPKFFMLFVEGGNSPSQKHTEIEKALSEAERLFKKTGKKVYILTPVCALEPKTDYNKIEF